MTEEVQPDLIVRGRNDVTRAAGIRGSGAGVRIRDRPGARVEGRLIITPIANPTCRLNDLLERITPENVHREADTGPSIGVEAW